jgi:hypothetical protein
VSRSLRMVVFGLISSMSASASLAARAQSSDSTPIDDAPSVTLARPPAQRVHADEDDDPWLGCADAAHPLEGVTPVVQDDGSVACRYSRVRRWRIEGETWTFALERSSSADEDHASLREDVALLDPRGTPVAALEQLDLEQVTEVTRLRVRRFLPLTILTPSGLPQPGLCIETIEELGPGFVGDWDEGDPRHPWRPSRRERAVDAWVIETEPQPRLRRRAAYDALCASTGYARFVDVGPREMGAVERRRVVGEAHLPDAVQRPPAPWRSPWTLGQPITLADVRRAFPGRGRYERAMGGTESSPEPHVPLFCVRRGVERWEPCLVRIELLSEDERQRMGLSRARGGRFAGSIHVSDPGYATGLDGVHVGARYVDIASRLERCELLHGDFEGLVCGLREAPGLLIDLEIRDDPRFADCVSEEWSSCPALDVATITDLALAPR